MTVTQFNKRWHSPSNVYMHLKKLEKMVGLRTLEHAPQWKQAREARIGAIIAFVITRMRKIPAMLRLPLQDPPDVYLLQANNGTMDITSVELTSYRIGARESLLDQLKRTKVKDYPTLSGQEILGIELLTEEGVDYQAINDYAVKLNKPFPIWSFRKIQDIPDTIAEVVIMNPKVSKFTVNIGEEAFYFDKQYKIPAVRFTKQTHDLNRVGTEFLGEECHIAPWEQRE